MAVMWHTVRKRSFLLFQSCDVWEVQCKIKFKRGKKAFVLGSADTIREQWKLNRKQWGKEKERRSQRAKTSAPFPFFLTQNVLVMK